MDLEFSCENFVFDFFIKIIIIICMIYGLLQYFLCPHLPKASVGHAAFCHDVTSVCVCHVHNQSLTNV